MVTQQVVRVETGILQLIAVISSVNHLLLLLHKHRTVTGEDKLSPQVCVCVCSCCCCLHIFVTTILIHVHNVVMTRFCVYDENRDGPDIQIV